MKIEPNHTLALLVDVQEKLLPPIYEKERLVKNCENLLGGLHLLQVPVLISQQYSKGLGATLPRLAALAPGAPVYDKCTFSCWEDSAIRTALMACGKKTVLLFGMESHICVQQTALALLDAGYRPVLVEDCCSCRNPHDHQLAVRRMERAGVIVTSWESVIYELAGSSRHPSFKAITDLIKNA